MVQKKRNTLYQDPISSTSLAQDTPLIPPTPRDVEQEVKKDLITEVHDLYNKHPVHHASRPTPPKIQPPTQPKQPTLTNHPAADVSNLSDEDLTQNEKIKQASSKDSGSDSTNQPKSSNTRASKPTTTIEENKTKQEHHASDDQTPQQKAISQQTPKAGVHLPHQSLGNDDTPPDKQQPKESEEKLNELIHQTNRVLIHIKSIFPLDVVPDELTVDEFHVNIKYKDFLGTGSDAQILVADITSIDVEKGPIDATLKITDAKHGETPTKITHLKKEEADEARQIIHGLVIASREGVKTGEIPTDTLKDKMLELGKIAGME